MKFISIIIASLCVNTSFYSLNMMDIEGSGISMNQFEGKKVLIVNIATNSAMENQIGQLQQLHELYGDSLVIIGFPSNSFGNETRSNAEIKSYCSSNYGVTFLLASKGSVSGSGVQPVYEWLSHINLNGMMENPVLYDFQKYLIDSDGTLIGVFSSSVLPLSSQLRDAL